MNNINSVLLEGTLHGDAVSLESLDGVEKTMCLLAVERQYMDFNEINVFMIHAYGMLAKRLAVLKNGHEIRVQGRLSETPPSTAPGHKAGRVVVIADNMEFKPEPKK